MIKITGVGSSISSLPLAGLLFAVWKPADLTVKVVLPRLAGHANLSAQSQHQRAGDVEAEAGAFSLPDQRIVEAAKFRKLPGDMLFGNAHALVPDGKLHHLGGALDAFGGNWNCGTEPGCI